MDYFPTTHWTLVRRAGQSESDAQREALSHLLVQYLQPLRVHLTRRRCLDPDRADDALQQFIADKVCERNLLEHADAERGKFRTFLLTSLDRFLISQIRKERAGKRSPDGGAPMSLDEQASGASGDDGEADAFTTAWARQVLDAAIARMDDHCRQTGRRDVWQVFDARVLGPTLRGEPEEPYDELVRKLGLTSPMQASNLLITAKRTFARVLRSVVGEYAVSDADIDEEVRDLQKVLGRGRA